MIDDLLGGMLEDVVSAARQLAFLLRYFDNLWVLLILFPLAAVLYIFIDSNRRNIQNAIFWRIAAIVNAALFLPTIVVAFDLVTAFLTTSWDILALFAYMGVASSIIAVGLAIGYWINFKDLPVEEYEPEFADNVYTPPPPIQDPKPISKPYKPSRPKVNAWLVMKSGGKNYQLYRGTTIIGRSSRSDIPIVADPTVSSQHIKIVEENGHYKMVDLGSTNGTWVNGHRVRQPILLDSNDEIRLGDNTYMKFIAS